MKRDKQTREDWKQKVQNQRERAERAEAEAESLMREVDRLTRLVERHVAELALMPSEFKVRADRDGQLWGWHRLHVDQGECVARGEGQACCVDEWLEGPRSAAVS